MYKYIFYILVCLVISTANAQNKIDRTKSPISGPAPIITIKNPVKFTFKNGLTILVVEDHKLPRVSANLFIDAGPINEGKKAGAVDLMGAMLNEGTITLKKSDFDEAVDQIGANVNLNANGGDATALKRYFEKAFKLMGDGIKNPAFTQSSFDKLKTANLNSLKASEKNIKVISDRVVSALLYGTQHPYGEFTSEESINNIQLTDVKDSYKKYITPSRAYLTIIGDITPDAAFKLANEVFGDWKGTNLVLPVVEKAITPKTTEIAIIDLPNAVQSEITVANVIDLKMSDPDYFAMLIANQIFGGGAESRININLREKHGFTYGAFSSVNADRYQGKFKTSSSVRTNKTDSAVVEFLSEIKQIRTNKVTEEELSIAKSLYNGSFALGLENPGRTASFARNILINNLPDNFYTTFLQNINKVTLEDVQKVAEKYLNYDNTHIFIVGNKAEILENLKKLNYPIKLYTPQVLEVK